ncbi:methyltransferase domain-containing protein [Clostridia bacterium OttesenSCG-928-F22]|nr:methyltransferase domain-containing protein [Clostridia bacterium OttesenSCG-928-F22]
MKTLYKSEYAQYNMLDYAMKLIGEVDLASKHILDIGCGYADIAQTLAKNHQYIGITEDEQTFQLLKSKDIEVHLYNRQNEQDIARYATGILSKRSVGLVCMFDYLGATQDPQALLEQLRGLCGELGAELLLSVPNIAHQDIAFKLLEGRFDYTQNGLLCSSFNTFFTQEKLAHMLKNSGFKETARNDYILEQTDQGFPKDSTLLSPSSLVYKHLSHVKRTIDPFAITYQFVRIYAALSEIKTEEAPVTKEERPFLSVIMRTQGMRMVAFREALLCLSAQTNTDFELLIVGHMIDNAVHEKVEALLREMPQALQDKTRIIKVNYGNRTAPLNEGFAHAKGEYVSIYDDDDIVFDHWVETFYKLYKKSPGCILHAYAATQRWYQKEKADGGVELSAASEMGLEYCMEYDPVNQLRENRCPTMSLAYPTYPFQKYNIRFNETLTTIEDWDFLMRTAALCGVADVPEVTSIYRLWIVGDSSRSIHSQNEWDINFHTSQDALDRNPVLLPSGSIQLIDELVQDKDEAESIEEDKGYSKLYYDKDGDGIKEEFCEKRFIRKARQNIDLTYYNMSSYPETYEVRWDPTEYEGVALQHFEAVIDYGDTIETVTAQDVSTNGNVAGDLIIFFCPDPQMTIPVKRGKCIQSIRIKGVYSREITGEMMEQAARVMSEAQIQEAEVRFQQERDSLQHQINLLSIRPPGFFARLRSRMSGRKE